MKMQLKDAKFSFSMDETGQIPSVHYSVGNVEIDMDDEAITERLALLLKTGEVLLERYFPVSNTTPEPPFEGGLN